MESQLCISKKQIRILLFVPKTGDLETSAYATEKREPAREYNDAEKSSDNSADPNSSFPLFFHFLCCLLFY